MDAADARAVLGVPPGAEPDAVRAAFRGLVRRHHPDISGSSGTAPTALLLEAYRVLRGTPAEAPAALPPAPASAPGPRPSFTTTAAWTEGDRVVVGAPPEKAWLLLVDVAHGLGAPSYVDGGAGLLETVVEFVDYPVCSVVMTVVGRPDGATEAGCAVEALGGGPSPPAEAVAALILDRLRTSFRRPGEA